MRLVLLLSLYVFLAACQQGGSGLAGDQVSSSSCPDAGCVNTTPGQLKMTLNSSNIYVKLIGNYDTGANIFGTANMFLAFINIVPSLGQDPTPAMQALANTNATLRNLELNSAQISGICSSSTYAYNRIEISINGASVTGTAGPASGGVVTHPDWVNYIKPLTVYDYNGQDVFACVDGRFALTFDGRKGPGTYNVGYSMKGLNARGGAPIKFDLYPTINTVITVSQ